MNASLVQLTPDVITKWSDAQHEPAWLTAQRARAWEQFVATPPPSKTEEAWKYTNLEKLGAWDQTAWSGHAAQCDFSLPDDAAAKGVRWTTLATALREFPALVEPYLAVSEIVGASPRRQFNGLANQSYGGARYLWQQEALWNTGALLYVPRGVHVEIPLHCSITLTHTGAAIFPRHVIILGEGASATVVDELRSAADLDPAAVASAHTRVEMYVGAGAQLRYVNIQNWHAGMRHLLHQHAAVERDGHFSSTTITMGAQVSKSVIESELLAPGAESFLFGLAFGDTTQHIDHHTIQTHLAPNTTSDLLFKTALKETAKSIYTGLIRMTKAAQQSSAYQANRNLLIGAGATANAIPQLEIEANDVKCSHGATIGPIDPEQCYYLMSRGLQRTEVEKIVVGGFFEDLLGRIPDAHAAEIAREAIWRKLGV